MAFSYLDEVRSIEKAASDFEARRGSTFDAAMDRANGWLATIRAALAEAGALSSEVDASLRLPGGGTEARAIDRAAPWSVNEISKLEAVVGQLPGSLRVLLGEIGPLTFLGGDGRRELTMLTNAESFIAAAAELEALIKKYDELLDPQTVRWAEHQAFPEVLDRIHPADLENARLLSLCGENYESQEMMLLHLRDDRGESPIVSFDYSDSESYYAPSGRDCIDWVERRIDRMIVTTTRTLVYAAKWRKRSV